MNVARDRGEFVPDDETTNGVSHGPPDDDDRPWLFESEGEHYPHATPEQLEAAKVTSAPLVRLLSADEFFAAEVVESLPIPALGIGPGPVNGMVGQTYAGKTIASCSMGLSVALGKDLWGAWRVQQGPWLHLDYEQGRRQTKKLIHRLARGQGITDEQLRALIAGGTIRIAILPDLRLTTDKASEHFRRVFEGVRLVTCDSLRPMLGGLDENSSQVRGYMAALSNASDSSGAAVSLIHHGGKTPNEGSVRTRKEMARGSSGIIDEFQSMFVLSKKKGDAVTLVTHEKDRFLGGTVSDFGLRFEDVSETAEGSGDPKWGLRVVHVDREQIASDKPTGDARLAKGIEAVRGCIDSHPGVAGTDAVRAIVCLDPALVRAAVGTLLASGEVVERKAPGRGKGRMFYLSHMAPPEQP